MTAVAVVKHDNSSKIREPIYIQGSGGSSPASVWDPTRRTFSLTLAGRQAESALCCRAETRTAHSVQHGASNLELLRLMPLRRLIIGCLSMHCYHLRDSSLPLQLLRLSERKKTEQGIYRDSKLLFSHSIASIKSRDFAPHCCQADDGCLRALFTRWNINTVCRVS